MTKTHLKRAQIKEVFPKVLQNHLGIVTNACLEVGLDRSSYYKMRKLDGEFAAKCDEVIETTADFVESALLNRIRDGDTPSIIFYCKTKLKHRGYVERIETTGKDGAPLNPIQLSERDNEIIKRSLQRMQEKQSHVNKEADGNTSVH